MRLPITVINTTFALFPSYCRLLVKFAFYRVVPVFNTIVWWVNSYIQGHEILTLKKLEESLYRMVLIY